MNEDIAHYWMLVALYGGFHLVVLGGFAIWLKTRVVRAPSERFRELRVLRLSGLACLLALLVAPLASSFLFSKIFPVQVFVFLVAVMAQGLLLFRAERKLRGIDATDVDYLRLGARAFAVMLVSMLGFIAVISTFTLVAVAIGGVPVILGGVFAGLVVGQLFLFATASLRLRYSLPCSRLRDQAMSALLSGWFRAAGLSCPDFFVIELEKFRHANAVVAGLSNGVGLLRPGLFFTRSLLRALEPGDLRAIVSHEIAHIALGHLKGRALAAIAVLAVGFVSALMVGHVLALLLVLSVGMFLLVRQWRAQELEADRFAIEALGADPGALCRALRRLDEINDQAAGADGGTHPSTSLRIARLEALAVSRVEQPNVAA